jgi:uncharacterized protein (DUF427 family)
MDETDWMWVYENPKDAAAKIDQLQAALKDIQAKSVGVNPPRHTWYYDRAEQALAPVSHS